MKTEQLIIKTASIASTDLKPLTALKPQLLLVFGSVAQFTDSKFSKTLKDAFPGASMIGCTTAGEVSNSGLSENTAVLTAIHFDSPKLDSAWAVISSPTQCAEAGMELAKKLKKPDLKAVFVIAPGLEVNGTQLVDGMKKILGEKTMISGGLAGDGGQFKMTYTVLNGEVHTSRVVAVGVYGEGIEVSTGSVGGWRPFGPARVVTKAKDNVLFELDGESALAVYKRYLGDDAKNLPGAGLRYPLAILNNREDETGVIRGCLGVDEAAGSLIFGGDIPMNQMVRLMHADLKGLVAGATQAAEAAIGKRKDNEGLCLIVSCVARKLVMGNETEEEIDSVRATFGGKNAVAGFYAYGEICPRTDSEECKLHNQTMTITWLSERKLARAVA